MVAFLFFIIATLEIVFGRKTVGRKRSFGDNVFKNPARYRYLPYWFLSPNYYYKGPVIIYRGGGGGGGWCK